MPHAEVKVVRCARGALFDVAVDVRPDSPSFRKWVGVELTADNGRALYIPKGFAHGFFTLSLLPTLLSECLTFRCEMVLNYGFDRIRFIGPVPSGSRIRGTFTLEDVQPAGEGAATLTWHAEVAVDGA